MGGWLLPPGVIVRIKEDNVYHFLSGSYLCAPLISDLYPFLNLQNSLAGLFRVLRLGLKDDWGLCLRPHNLKVMEWDLNPSLFRPSAVRFDMSQIFNLGDCLGCLHANLSSNNWNSMRVLYNYFFLISIIRWLQRLPPLSYKDIKWK